MKRCGKSAPRPRRRGWQGKPHREQDRIGGAGGAVSVSWGRDAGVFPPRSPGWSRQARGNARRRGMVVPRPYGGGQNPAYRPSGTSLANCGTPSPILSTARTNRESAPFAFAVSFCRANMLKSGRKTAHGIESAIGFPMDDPCHPMLSQAIPRAVLGRGSPPMAWVLSDRWNSRFSSWARINRAWTPRDGFPSPRRSAPCCGRSA